MTDNKRTFSQRGDDYLIEAQRLCAETRLPAGAYCQRKQSMGLDAGQPCGQFDSHAEKAIRLILGEQEDAEKE